MPMLTVRLSDEEHARLKMLAGTGSVASRVKGWITAPPSDAVGQAVARANAHAQCDAKIAELEAEVARLRAGKPWPPPQRVPLSSLAEADPEANRLEVKMWDAAAKLAPKPSFLAAPDDDCHTCLHDRHANAHVYGPCQAWVASRRRCLCGDFDLGFE